jgi:radical SAM superfamily enzyme YgiQ (UPF0313 family)
MKIIFLSPPSLDSKPAAERIFGCNYGIYMQQNIFILYPATILKNKGHDVDVLDCPIEDIDEKGLHSFLESNNSDIYVFYTVFLSKKTDMSARDMIRKLRPNAYFIYMGTEPTVAPEDFVADDSFVIRGEPELTISELIEGIEGKRGLNEISGITFMDNGRVIENPSRKVIMDLDVLPFPDRAMLKKVNYHNPKLSKRPFTTIISSRGCAYNCYYCVPNSLDFAREIEYERYDVGKRKPPVRMRSAENVIEEMKMLYYQGFRSISFLDDQFVWNSQRVMDICKGIKDMGIEWSCLARADHLINEEVVKKMAEAGCKYIDIGVESFDQRILDYIHKDLKVEEVYKAVALLKKYHIEPELNVLIGSCPLETKETIEYTISETMKLDVDYVLFSICTPFPHTLFYEVAKKSGWMVVDEYVPIDPIRESLISYPHLTKEEMEKIIKRAYRRFYFRPQYILKRLCKLGGIRDFINKSKAAISILRNN